MNVCTSFLRSTDAPKHRVVKLVLDLGNWSVSTGVPGTVVATPQAAAAFRRARWLPVSFRVILLRPNRERNSNARRAADRVRVVALENAASEAFDQQPTLAEGRRFYRPPKMKELPISASDEDVKNVIRQWARLLAGEQYDKALELISPAVLAGSGSLDPRAAPQWTAQLLEAVINHYGVPESLEDSTHKYKVSPVDASLRAMFEARLDVDRQHFSEFGQSYLGTIHVDLPLIYEDRVSLSDLTARFYLSPIGGAEMVLVLLDIHVL